MTVSLVDFLPSLVFHPRPTFTPRVLAERILNASGDLDFREERFSDALLDEEGVESETVRTDKTIPLLTR